ncbi:hypothetical protein [Lichenibacterium dinghuense]|uniref:hypothetical protein n=1 Tax=Lichenibacterium dinghuense TaxID=2895977 RepID=UPI001F3A1730|nr:hypothetical protein [Lichenibacterium sp. 6Y81]
MATQTLTALFDRYEDAAETVRRLEAAGVPHDDISLVSNDASHSQYHGAIPGDAAPMSDVHHPGTNAGASLGTLLGGGAGLLAGLGMLAIPGLGPVVAAGWLASTLLGAGVGAAAGGIVGSLTDVGVSETDAHAYAEGVGRGGTLLTVKADAAEVDRVSDILGHDAAVHMPDREGSWRDEGWSGQYVGRGAVTGTPVFTDPTMLAPAPGAVTGPAPDLSPADVPSIGAASPAAGPLPPDEIGRGDRRGRVRIYDGR